MAESACEAVLQKLGQAATAGGENLRCNDLIKMLEALGFSVTRCSSGNHYKFTHSQIVGFAGGNFNGGSGKNPQILPAYIRSVRRTLIDWKDELKQLET